MEALTNLPEDRIVTSFSFDAPDTSTATLDDLETMIVNFYQDNSGGQANRLDYYLASTVSRSVPVSVAYYDMTQPQPRVPLRTDTFTLGAPGNNNSLPQEICVCTSYHATFQSGIAKARQRGRIYFGPLTISTSLASTGQPARPTTDLIGDLRIATNRLCVQSGTNGAPWSVWSRVNSTLYPITGGWVDNEFDTQRRRGRLPTSRSSWTTVV